jgi:hypothetical protein
MRTSSSVADIVTDEVLVARRRLGQTDLTVKAGQMGISNATKPKNLGTFDYAHLRAPLPKNVMSGIFRPAPPSYFLMRRSQDGYISATGMFKATFPWAELAEEEAERKYIKSLPTTSTDDTAGNVWIPPAHALELAEEYQITPWIKALLDNEPIEVNPAKDSSPKTITPPPKFLLPQEALAPPTPATARGRVRRSASPSKIASPKKASATPRKPKTPKAGSTDSHTKPANKSLQDSLKETVTKVESDTSVRNGEPVVRVNVDTDVQVNGNVETTHTHVEVEMPAGSPELPLPEDTEGMIAKAKEMVEAAVKAEAAGPSKPKKLKRKAVEGIDEEDKEGSSEAGPAVKKAKVETDLKKERIKTRTLIGISATLAVG